jgi:hypothetical protein
VPKPIQPVPSLAPESQTTAYDLLRGLVVVVALPVLGITLIIPSIGNRAFRAETCVEGNVLFRSTIVHANSPVVIIIMEA